MTRTEWLDWYSKKYLKSKHWGRTRARILWRDKHTCQVKGCEEDRYSLQVHHLTYVRVSPLRLWLCEVTGLDIFGEWNRDLKTMCAWHHEQIKKGFVPKWKGWWER